MVEKECDASDKCGESFDKALVVMSSAVDGTPGMDDGGRSSDAKLITFADIQFLASLSCAWSLQPALLNSN